MNVDDYWHSARILANGKTKPRQVYLRRAVSAAYYALFHELCALCADQLIGKTKRGSEDWVRAYRSVDHGTAKSEFVRQEIQRLSPRAANFAHVFVLLQDERHTADYDPRPFRRGRRDVLVLIQQARRAVLFLRKARPEDKLKLAARVALKARNR